MIIDVVRAALSPALLAGGVLLPGWLLGRALGTPGGMVGSLLGSAIFLTDVVLLLDTLGIPIDAAHLALALAILCGVLTVIAHKRSDRLPALNFSLAFKKPERPWLLIPALLGVLTIAARATLDPLSGLDTHFRWDFL